VIILAKHNSTKWYLKIIELCSQDHRYTVRRHKISSPTAAPNIGTAALPVVLVRRLYTGHSFAKEQELTTSR
jgi:hypothetical protein